MHPFSTFWFRRLLGSLLVMILLGSVDDANAAAASPAMPGAAGLATSAPSPMLTTSSPASPSEFGAAVVASEEIAIVGAPLEQKSLGAAYVFVQAGGVWSQQARLIPPDRSAHDHFGDSVALSGSIAVIGAPVLKNGGAGGAYVFEQRGTAWHQQAELIATDHMANDMFGHSVALSGNTAVVGAYSKNNQTGVAYVFVRSGGTWHQQAELTAADGTVSDLFGYSVAMNGDTALIGAFYKNSIMGAVYVFVRHGKVWTQQAKLTATDGAQSDGFGYSVAVNGGTAVIGANGKNGGMGAAYVFVRSGSAWIQQTELTASDGTASDGFGQSVAVNGGTIMIGAPFKNNYVGEVYTFVQSGGAWRQQATLLAADGIRHSYFGQSVAVSGGTSVIGAPIKNYYKGAVYVFARSGSTWIQQAELAHH